MRQYGDLLKGYLGLTILLCAVWIVGSECDFHKAQNNGQNKITRVSVYAKYGKKVLPGYLGLIGTFEGCYVLSKLDEYVNN